MSHEIVGAKPINQRHISRHYVSHMLTVGEIMRHRASS